MSEQGNIARTNIPFDYLHSNPMSHEEALEMNAVELYVLKELTAEQETRFEEHYFDCQDCACGVAVEQALFVNGQPRPAQQKWWQLWAPRVLAPVTALLLSVVAFLGYQLSALQTPLANTVILAQKAVMGTPEGDKRVSTPSVTINVNLPADAPPAHFYRIVLIGEGKPPISNVLPAPEHNLLSLQLLSRTLQSGDYNVIVYGLSTKDAKDGPQIGQYFLNIQLR